MDRLIPTTTKLKAARNFASGFLLAYGFISFFCFLFLDQAWMRAAPRSPMPELGLDYLHNEHGTHAYFSAFQDTSCALLFITSIPLAFLGIWLAPKKNVVVGKRMLSWSRRWDADDPKNLRWAGMFLGSLATPPLVFVVGPILIANLNHWGIVLHPG